MSLFGNILEKLGVGGGAATGHPPPTSTAPPPTTGKIESTTLSAGPPPGAPTPTPTPSSTTQTPVDISALLEQRAAASSQKLNWRTSIVDLLKLLDIDSSIDTRKQLATELGCPPEFMSDSAKMNTWLHKAVLARVAANGGIVPKELLH
jgi:hypothetical protein